MFTVKSYLKSKLWESDDTLVDPSTAVKYCPVCDAGRYSTEFSNAEEYEDGKLPVCSQCLMGKKTAVAAMKVIVEKSKIRICRKCKRQFPIENFIQVSVSTWESSQKCSECSGI